MDDVPSLKQRIYEMLADGQFWPPEQMLVYHRSQLAHSRWHVNESMPFYNTRLDPVFKKDCEIDCYRPHKLPNLARADIADIKEHGAAMMAKTLPRGHRRPRALAPVF